MPKPSMAWLGRVWGWRQAGPKKPGGILETSAAAAGLFRDYMHQQVFAFIRSVADLPSVARAKWTTQPPAAPW